MAGRELGEQIKARSEDTKMKEEYAKAGKTFTPGLFEQINMVEVDVAETGIAAVIYQDVNVNGNRTNIPVTIKPTITAAKPAGV